MVEIVQRTDKVWTAGARFSSQFSPQVPAPVAAPRTTRAVAARTFPAASGAVQQAVGVLPQLAGVQRRRARPAVVLPPRRHLLAQEAEHGLVAQLLGRA